MLHQPEQRTLRPLFSNDTDGSSDLELDAISYAEPRLDHKLKGSILVVIPAFNEELTIGSVVLGALKYTDKVIVVDDGSNDRTGELARLAGAEVLRQVTNTGKACALLRGLKAASKEDRPVTIMMDADGQHRAEDIPSIAGPVLDDKADLVIGSRFIGSEEDIPRFRVYGQKVINSLSNAGASVELTDSQSGLRALSRRALKNLDFSSDGYNIESDMIAHFVEKGLTITEVPITARYDVPERAQEGLDLDGARVAW